MADSSLRTSSDNDTNSEADSDCNASVPNKKAKLSGAAKYQTRFQKEWTTKYPFLSSVHSDRSKYRCNICNKTLSCGHQGEADVKRHISSDAHMASEKAQIRQPAITSLLRQPNSDLNEKVSTAFIVITCYHSQ